MKESELTQALQAATDAREEAQGALKDIQEVRKIAAGKAFFLFKAIVYVAAGKNQGDKLTSDFSRVVCGSSMQHI